MENAKKAHQELKSNYDSDRARLETLTEKLELEPALFIYRVKELEADVGGLKKESLLRTRPSRLLRRKFGLLRLL